MTQPETPKRSREDSNESSDKAKRARTDDGGAGGKRVRLPMSRVVLNQYYASVVTLREYVLSRLPTTSRIRKRKISRLGIAIGVLTKVETEVCRLLDTTLVGLSGEPYDQTDERWKKWVTFSQKNDESHVSLSGKGTFSHPDLVDFAVWLLFSRAEKARARPKHLLCDGFRKTTGLNTQRQAGPVGVESSIPGLLSMYPNHHVEALKRPPWPQLLLLLGQAGERIMVDLLVDCAVYVSVDAGVKNMWQLSGTPLSELDPIIQMDPPEPDKPGTPCRPKNPAVRSPGDITFVRSRILYARAGLTARGNIETGLRHIHILNRAPYKSKEAYDEGKAAVDSDVNREFEDNTLRVMAYMFPRQFGLHNAFTSHVDRQKSAQKFQDYTLREDEISSVFRRVDQACDGGFTVRIRLPKRLRGRPKELVERLQILHARCSYVQILDHYCPNPLTGGAHKQASHSQRIEWKPAPAWSTSTRVSNSWAKKTSKRKNAKNGRSKKAPTLNLEGKSVVDLATPVSQVSAFCQRVLSKIIPNEFWGVGSTQQHNKELVLRNVDRFIRLRRFENISLHDVYQGIRVSDIEWLSPPHLRGSKMTNTDKLKRVEIFLEFLYYIFDSLLIPLIRSNFYVTDSGKHKYRLFYFRHDVWRRIAEPATAVLKSRLLEEISMNDAKEILASRTLGTSHLRLLPKDSTLRPIMNLRRRAFLRGGRQTLGPSINSILAPVHSMLSLEKDRDPSRLGASLFSVPDLYTRLKSFCSKLPRGPRKMFYFAKVDVQAAFDTMPQAAVVELMKTIPSDVQYLISKYVEVKPGDAAQNKAGVTTIKPSKRWLSLATTSKDNTRFSQQLKSKLAPNKRNTIFVDNVMKRVFSTKFLMSLLTSHVENNLVKIGKKYYRQKCGVPQGSILSTVFCNYFYADLERRHLSFLADDDETLLLRLIDDFLLITTDKSKAERFLTVMHAGLPDYGVTVSLAKTLVNFPMEINSEPLPQWDPSSAGFPYCGTLIDPTTLAISKNRPTGGKQLTTTDDSLTVESSRRPGRNFERKTLNAFRLQSHMMFYDTSHNPLSLSLANLDTALAETARKACAYIRCLPREKRPREHVFVRTIRKLVDVTYPLLTSAARRARFPGYECAITRTQVQVATLGAFGRVVRAKQPGYEGVIGWIEKEMGNLESSKKLKRKIRLGSRNTEM